MKQESRDTGKDGSKGERVYTAHMRPKRCFAGGSGVEARKDRGDADANLTGSEIRPDLHSLHAFPFIGGER